MAVEANFDGLIGPTHNYSGLAYGNVASAENAGGVSDPRAAALQGLAKMKALADWGYVQGVLAPQERPDVAALRRLGFAGSEAQVLAGAAAEPALLAACSSASAMWTANAATVSPSADTHDGRVHFTPANLVSKYHRALEAPTTAAILRTTFADPEHFCHHEPLPGVGQFGDEGAANHTRFAADYGARGVEFFVYGRRGFADGLAPRRFPARQTLEAGQAIARLHGLDAKAVVHAQQNPAVIDAGVFHNDVIAVGNRDVLFCHAQAFADPAATYAALRAALAPVELRIVEVPGTEVAVADAVQSYLFNSQLLDRADGRQRLVVPKECSENPRVAGYLAGLMDAGGPIAEVKTLDVKQSMRNGGGPACLRLRVVLTESELAAVNPACLLSDQRYDSLVNWVRRHYRDRLRSADLADPQLLQESRQALDELTQLLALGPIYGFQR